MSRRILLLSLSVPPSRPSNGEDDEMAEKEGETKYANINKEEGGREGYEEEEKKDSQGVEEGGEDRGWRSAAAEVLLWTHFCT